MSDTETALATVPQQTTTAMMAEAFGMGEDYFPKPTKVELVQPINANGRVAGAYYDAQSNEKFDRVMVVPLQFNMGKVFFETGELGQKPLCRSNDGKQPSTKDPDLVRQDGGRGCKTCPRAQWKQIKGRDGRTVKVKPECGDTMSVLFANLETGFTHRLNVKRSNVPPLRDFRETIFKKVIEYQMKKNPKPHFAFLAELRSTQIVGKKGTYFEILFGAPKLITDELLEGYGIGSTAEEYINRMAAMYSFYVINNGGYDDDEAEATPEAQADKAIDNAVEQEYVEA